MVDNISKTEEEFIYLLLHNRKLVTNFIDSNLSVEHFNDKYRFILNCIIECYDLNVLLTRKTFLEKVKILSKPQERIAQEMLFNVCFVAKTSEDDFPTLINKIFDYIIDNSVNSTLSTFKKEVKEDRITAINNVVDDFQDILSNSSSTREKVYYNNVNMLSDENIQYIKDVRDGKIEEKKLILTGIKEYDETMVTGLEKGTLTLICSDVGSYKSSMMMNIGMNVWKDNHNVLFVPLEMDKDQIWKRMISRESRVPCDLITSNIKGLTNEQIEKMEQAQEEWHNREAMFYLMQESTRTTVINIERQIERNINMFKPKLVIIDYIANLEAHTKRGTNTLEIGDMLKTMRHMGKSLGFAVISGAQLGRNFLEKLRIAGANRDKISVNSEDIRGSHEYSADADYIYAQIKSASQPNELLDIYCIKSRSGSTTFKNGSIRATLDVSPEIFWIRSQNYDFGDVNDILDDYDEIEKDANSINKQELFSEEKEVEKEEVIDNSSEEEDWDF